MNKHQYFAGDGQAYLAHEATEKLKKCRIWLVTLEEWKAIINEKRAIFYRGKTNARPF